MKATRINGLLFIASCFFSIGAKADVNCFLAAGGEAHNQTKSTTIWAQGDAIYKRCKFKILGTCLRYETRTYEGVQRDMRPGEAFREYHRSSHQLCDSDYIFSPEVLVRDWRTGVRIQAWQVGKCRDYQVVNWIPSSVTCFADNFR